MKLAEEIVIELAGEVVELRPSLRHAIRLERRDGGFRQLFQDLRDGSLTAAVDIIEPHYRGDMIEHRVMDAMHEIRPALIAYALACAGIDPDKTDNGKTPSKRAKPGAKERSYTAHFEALFKFGTGWLGWTPEATLDATPAEITLAFEGHLEKLKAIHGGNMSSEKETDDRPLDEKFRSIFRARGTQKEG